MENLPNSTLLGGNYLQTSAITSSRAYADFTSAPTAELEMGDNMTFNVTPQDGGCNNTGFNGTICSAELPRIIVSPLDIAVALFLSAFIVCIIIGNILVVSSVILFRDMRTLTNALIVSLALADLLVALIVLPLSLHYEVADYIWRLGPIICDFWITSDVFCCTASILNIVVIAMDRYWLITRNVRYTHSVRFPRKKVCFVMVSLAWSLSLIISISPLLGWTSGHKKAPLGECAISQDLGYTIFSTFGAFWFPLSVIIVTYFHIFKIAKSRAQSRAKSRSICPSIEDSTFRNGVYPSSFKRESVDTRSSMVSRRLLDIAENEAVPVQTAPCETNGNPSAINAIEKAGTDHQLSPTTILTDIVEHDVCVNDDHETNTDVTNNVSTIGKDDSVLDNNTPQSPDSLEHKLDRKSSAKSMHRNSYFSLKRRKRFRRLGHVRSSRMLYRNKIRSSARTLGLIIGCFVLCWMPFFLIATTIPFCAVCRENIPPVVYSVTLWLGYSNSLLNPAIYAIWDKNFRRSFKKIVKCKINWGHVF